MEQTKFFSDQSTPAGDHAATPFSYKLLRFGALISLWYRRTRQRKALAELDDRLLQDVNITSSQVLAETNKPFWRA